MDWIQETDEGQAFYNEKVKPYAAGAAVSGAVLFATKKYWWPLVRRGGAAVAEAFVAKPINHRARMAVTNFYKQAGSNASGTERRQLASLVEAGEITMEQLAKAGRSRTAFGFSTPWSQMSKAERKALQHAYSRHADQFGLPNWQESQAEALRGRLNDSAQLVRDSAQNIFLRKHPQGGQSVWTREYRSMIGGRDYYYYESLDGTYISSGLVTP